ncbi:MAG TPA: ACT domain-containing protein [Candidatus Sulfotelmatobacter sp.]|nr:ACT domain-containing protein [Candidatus Sulfotelmatobacter sp.]
MNHAGDPNPQRRRLEFRCLPGLYAIVRLQPQAVIPEWAGTGALVSITRSADELSVVCPAENVPASLRPPQCWICLKLEGPFPFSLTGVLLSFIEPLSDNAVPIFAVSTYDTDYVLVPQEFSKKAISLLQQAGHQLGPATPGANSCSPGGNPAS